MVAPTGIGHNPAYQEVVLYAAGGQLRLPLYRGGDARRLPQEAPWKGSWASGEGKQNDVPRRVQTFDRGAGFAHRPVYTDNATEWNGFAESENVCTRFGSVVLSGEQTVVAVPSAWGPVVKLIGYHGDLFIICEVIVGVIPGGTGALASVYSRPGDAWTDAELWQDKLRIANTCTHNGVGAGFVHSFLTIESPAAGGPPYTSTQPDMAGTGGVELKATLLTTVFWEHEGVAGYRLVSRVDLQAIRYMIVPNGDPYDPLNWGPITNVGDTSFPIDALVASHDTVWAVKRDGVYAITDKNAMAGGENLTPYWKDQLDAMSASSKAYYFEDRLIVARPYGIEAVDVQSWQVQDRPRRADIAHGRPNDTLVNGRYTALGSDNGWLVAAQASHDAAARILYGIPRPRESPSSGITEYDWFPEVGPIPGQEVQAVYVFTPASTGRPSLWLGMHNPSTGAPQVIAVDLFRGSTPLADPLHRYALQGSITATDEHWGTRRSNKSAVVAAAAVRYCGDGRKVDFYTQAGAGNTFPGAPISTISTNIEASHFSLYGAFPRANVVRFKAVLTRSPAAPNVSPVLYEWELKAHLALPLRRRGTFLAEVGTLTARDLPTIEDPTAIEVLLVSLAEGAENVSMVNPEGEHSVVVIENVVPWRYEERSDSTRRVRVYEISYTQVS